MAAQKSELKNDRKAGAQNQKAQKVQKLDKKVAAKASSKLASFQALRLAAASTKSALFSAAKKKLALPTKSAVAAKPELPQKNGKGKAKKAAPAKPAPAAANRSKPQAAPVSPAAKETRAKQPAGRAGKKGGKKVELPPQERMAGPSIRVTYDANGEAVCREVACEGLSTSNGYCRMHYIKNWKKIKRKEVILKEGKLNQYIEELVAKYPDKYIEAIRQDLANDKDFAKVIYDLDLDESVDDFEGEGESIDAIVGDIKRDFDDEGDAGF